MGKLLDLVCKELEAFGEKGITINNLATASTLVDMYKDLYSVKYWQAKMEAMEGDAAPMRVSVEPTAYSGEGKDNHLAVYMAAKSEYRGSRSAESRTKMIDALDDYMTELCSGLDELLRDADVQEERDLIRRHIRRVRESN